MIFTKLVRKVIELTKVLIDITEIVVLTIKFLKISKILCF